MDLGFGSLFDRFDKSLGEGPTLALTVLIGLAGGLTALRLSIEALLWVFRAFRTGGQSVGLMTLQDWAALALTISIGVVAVFVVFVIFDKLWISKKIEATQRDTERIFEATRRETQRIQATQDERDATRAMVNETSAEVAALRRHVDEALRRLDIR